MYGSHIKKMISSAKSRNSFSNATIEGTETETETETETPSVSNKDDVVPSVVDERDISLAVRALDALETVLAPRLITCAQMYVLLSHFPDSAKNITISKHSTFRVELIVRFFTIIADMIHFDFILKVRSYIRKNLI